MSCSDGVPCVEREIELSVPPDAVWDALPALLGDDVDLTAEPGGRLRARGPDGEHLGVVAEVDPPRRLTFWWVPAHGDGPASMVELELFPTGPGTVPAGTVVRVRETSFDAVRAVDDLLRGPLAHARA
jgi:uncharacterized protein YndB with AHSA1/START domain